jgi:multidrug resistance efflux pump
MLRMISTKRIKNLVEDAVREAARQAEHGIERLAELRKKISDLEIDHARKKEEWDRREREVEHKVGLERKRQEFEIEQAKRETQTSVREENLKADKERFKSEMDFQRARLEEEVKSLRDLVAEMMKRLPSAEIYADLTGGKKR